MSKEQAEKLAADAAHENLVHGYGRQDDGYGGPYHPDAFLDPKVEFAFGGDPEAAADWNKDLKKLDEAKAKKGPVDKVDLVAASAHSTVVESLPHRVLGKDELVKPATPETVREAQERKHPAPVKKATAAPKKAPAKKAAAKKAPAKKAVAKKAAAKKA